MTTRAPAYTSSRPLDAPPPDAVDGQLQRPRGQLRHHDRREHRRVPQQIRAPVPPDVFPESSAEHDRSIDISTERTTKLSRRLYHRVSAPHSRTQDRK